MGPPDRERVYIYRSLAGLRRTFSFSGARSLEKQTVKARWSLIKVAPLPGRSPLIRVDLGAAHRKGPGRVLGPARLHYTRGQAGMDSSPHGSASEMLAMRNQCVWYVSPYRHNDIYAGCRTRGSACCTHAFIFHECPACRRTLMLR